MLIYCLSIDNTCTVEVDFESIGWKVGNSWNLKLFWYLLYRDLESNIGIWCIKRRYLVF